MAELSGVGRQGLAFGSLGIGGARDEVMLAKLPLCGGERWQEFLERGGRIAMIGQMMGRFSAERDPFEPLAAAFAAKVAGNLGLCYGPKKRDQPGPSARIVAAKESAVLFNQGVPDPGGDLVNQIRIGIATGEQCPDRRQEHWVMVTIELVPRINFARKTTAD